MPEGCCSCLPEGIGEVEQDLDQLSAVTVGVEPDGVPGADGHQGMATFVSGTYRRTE